MHEHRHQYEHEQANEQQATSGKQQVASDE
jgi:hypothetical protein